jgi:hypothetical protein
MCPNNFRLSRFQLTTIFAIIIFIGNYPSLSFRYASCCHVFKYETVFFFNKPNKYEIVGSYIDHERLEWAIYAYKSEWFIYVVS